VSDGSLSNAESFVLTVNAVNDAPTISDIPDQTIYQNSWTGPIHFTIGDIESDASSLVLSASSSNPTLVPNGNIAFGGSDANRTVKVTPALLQSGTATITVTVSDGVATASDSFVVTVNSVVVLGIAQVSGSSLHAEALGVSGSPNMVLEIKGAPGTSYQIEASEDFVSWTAVGTFQSATGSGTFRDASGGDALRIYRVREAPVDLDLKLTH